MHYSTMTALNRTLEFYNLSLVDVRANLQRLEPRSQMMLASRFGLGADLNDRPHTLQEVADQWGLTRERVRQIVNEELYRIQTYCKK